MLMGQDDGAKVGELPSDLFQPLAGLARTEAGIDQDARPVTLEVIRIPRAARSERSDKHGVMVTQLRSHAVSR